MRDYRQSRFWGMLRKIDIYPHDVRVWKSKVVMTFHRMTFGVFINKKKLARDLEGIRPLLAMSDEDYWDRIEGSL